MQKVHCSSKYGYDFPTKSSTRKRTEHTNAPRLTAPLIIIVNSGSFVVFLYITPDSINAKIHEVRWHPAGKAHSASLCDFWICQIPITSAATCSASRQPAAVISIHFLNLKIPRPENNLHVSKNIAEIYCKSATVNRFQG